MPERWSGKTPSAADSGLGVDAIVSHGRGFMLLDERPMEEVVVGAVGQFRHVNIPFKDVKPTGTSSFRMHHTD